MKNVIFVGDMHGDITLMQNIVDRFVDTEHIIFLGDFLDSFRYDVTDQIECVRLALKLAENGQAEVIMGNHELSYLDPDFNRCSGYNTPCATHVIHLKNRMWKLFKPYIYMKDENILVTHAGLTKYFWDELELKMDTFTDVFDKMIKGGTRTRYYDVGRARGGINKFGGPMWCDYRREFKYIPELNQVFGHTPVHGIWPYYEYDVETKTFAIDCLQDEKQVLRYNREEKRFEVITL